MKVKKQYLKSKPEVKITFEIEVKDSQDADNIVLLSEHNNWQPIDFKKLKSGTFKLMFNVSTTQMSGFQYIFQAQKSNNQEFTLLPADADDYVDNGMNDGGKNALLQIS